MHFFSRLRLLVKFSLLIICLVVAVTTVVLIVIYHHEQELITAEARSRGLDLATMLAVAGVRASLEDDYLVLQELVDSIGQSEGIEQAMILNPDGKVLVHTRAAERDQIYDDDSTLRVLRLKAAEVFSHRLDNHEVLDVAAPIIVTGMRVGYARVMISLRRAEAALRKTASLIGMLGLGGTLVALLVGTGLSKLVTRPLNRLCDTAQRISRGERNVKIDVTAHDEIGILQKVLRLMIDDVRRQSGLAALGTTTANLAHEIRSPLALITRHLNQLTTDFEALQGHRQKILVEINRLNDLMEQLLSFSKQQKLQLGRVDANDLIAQALHILDGQIQGRGIIVVCNLADLPLLVADKSLLQSVFVNLISNALDAMDRNGRLSIETKMRSPGLKTSQGSARFPSARGQAGDLLAHLKARLRNRIASLWIEPAASIAGSNEARQSALQTGAMIIITDTGHGIPAENMDRLFMPFFTTKPNGNGLGLALSLKIIEAHGGTLVIDSRIGQGTTVTIILPI